jgi:hypothetical protein
MLQNKELQSLCRSSNIVRVIRSRKLRWAGHLSRMEEGRSAFKVVRGKPSRKTPQGRPKRRLEDDVILDLKEIVNSTRNWVVSGEDRDYWRVLLNELHKPWI